VTVAPAGCSQGGELWCALAQVEVEDVGDGEGSEGDRDPGRDQVGSAYLDGEGVAEQRGKEGAVEGSLDPDQDGEGSDAEGEPSGGDGGAEWEAAQVE
jgi:hypothetical protein